MHFDALNTRQFLLSELRRQLNIPSKFSDDLIEINLMYFFANDERSALSWIYFVEKRFSIKFDEIEIDMFFFSDIEIMVQTIEKHLQYQSGRS